MSDQKSRYIGKHEKLVLDIIRTAELFTRVGSTCVFDKQLTQARFNILLILKYFCDGDVSQKEILSRMVSTKSNLSTHIKKLAAHGYIKKVSSIDDRRHDKISLTDKGDDAVLRLEPEYEQHVAFLTNDLTEDELEITAKTLDKIQTKCYQIFNPEHRDTEF